MSAEDREGWNGLLGDEFGTSETVITSGFEGDMECCGGVTRWTGVDGSFSCCFLGDDGRDIVLEFRWV